MIADFLKVGDDGEETQDAWFARAEEFGKNAKEKMLVNPGKDAGGIAGEFKTFFGHLAGGEEMEGWQQFVVHARDERGDGVNDYLIDVLTKQGDQWVAFEEMYTDVHAYKTDPSYRCFHIRLPKGISNGAVPLMLRVHASSGTELMVYQGYGSNETQTNMTADAAPVEIDLSALADAGASLFHPFTTTMVEIILNREPYPLNGVSRLFGFLP